MLSFRDMPSALVTRSHSPEVNSDPLSEMMSAGRPWGRTTCFTKQSATPVGSIVPSQATKCPILVIRSMITHRVSFLLLAGSPVIKSIDMKFHGLCGGSMGFKSPNGACLTGMIRRHMSQWSTYWWTYLCCCGQ